MGVFLLYVVVASQLYNMSVYCCYIWEFFVLRDYSCTVVLLLEMGMFLLYEMVAAQLYDI